MNERKTGDASANYWTVEYQEFVHQIANRLVNGATPGQVAGDLQQEHGWSHKAAMEVARDAQQTMATEGSQVVEELDAEKEEKSGGSGLFGKAVGILLVVAFFLASVIDWPPRVVLGAFGIVVAAGVAGWLGRIVMRRRHKAPDKEVFPMQGDTIGAKGARRNQPTFGNDRVRGPGFGAAQEHAAEEDLTRPETRHARVTT